jgi:hypothetical protein
MKTVLLLITLSITSCGTKQQQATIVNEFYILRLRIMERMAGNESSN